ncbi:hypothetical protein PR048_029425 [Dryococelus australis]|uniref:Uncharacterized protein n=1 Tax=Dryococelus australis TaxID=614101 RepID=A0ABQ9GG57_9NEOP|nr:hypothetical protein PR048_029425 [Dryococelus australis]
MSVYVSVKKGGGGSTVEAALHSLVRWDKKAWVSRRGNSMSWTMLRLEQNDREGAGGLRVRGRGHSTVGCHVGPAERLVSCVRARRRLVARADSWGSRSLVCSGGGGETGGGRKDTRRGAVSYAPGNSAPINEHFTIVRPNHVQFTQKVSDFTSRQQQIKELHRLRQAVARTGREPTLTREGVGGATSTRPSPRQTRSLLRRAHPFPSPCSRWDDAVLRGDGDEGRRGWSSAGMKGRGEMGDPRENPPTSSIVRHDSHMRGSGDDPRRESNPVLLGAHGDYEEVVSTCSTNITEANRVRLQAGSLRIFASGILPDDASGRRVFSGISCFPVYSFRRCSIFTSLYPRRGDCEHLLGKHGDDEEVADDADEKDDTVDAGHGVVGGGAGRLELQPVAVHLVQEVDGEPASRLPGRHRPRQQELLQSGVPVFIWRRYAFAWQCHSHFFTKTVIYQSIFPKC